MLIRCQNGSLVQFESVSSVSIAGYHKDGDAYFTCRDNKLSANTFCVEAITMGSRVMGEYTSEQQAQLVVDSIMSHYENNELAKLFPSLYQFVPVFIMPKEVSEE